MWSEYMGITPCLSPGDRVQTSLNGVIMAGTILFFFSTDIAVVAYDLLPNIQTHTQVSELTFLYATKQDNPLNVPVF